MAEADYQIDVYQDAILLREGDGWRHARLRPGWVALAANCTPNGHERVLPLFLLLREGAHIASGIGVDEAVADHILVPGPPFAGPADTPRWLRIGRTARARGDFGTRQWCNYPLHLMQKYLGDHDDLLVDVEEVFTQNG